MNETKRTTIFVVAAVVAAAALVGFQQMQRSWLPDVKPGDMVGKQLFDDFQPLAVTSLQIVKYDEATGTPSGFEVSQINNRWSIPSHSNYPTDAKDQLAEAAASVLGLKVLNVESDSPGDHKLFGVLDPAAKTLQAGAVGVGTRVTMKGKKARR